jgi:hypothetical protein
MYFVIHEMIVKGRTESLTRRLANDCTFDTYENAIYEAKKHINNPQECAYVVEVVGKCSATMDVKTERVESKTKV